MIFDCLGLSWLSCSSQELKRLALEAKKKAIEADIQKIVDVLTEAEPAVAKAEEAGKAEHLSRDYLNGTPEKDAVTTAMESASAALKDAQGELGEVRTRLADLVSSADDDVKQWVQLEIRKVEMKVAAMDARLAQTGQAAERGRQFLQAQEAKELKAAKLEVAKLLRSKKLDAEELFKAWHLSICQHHSGAWDQTCEHVLCRHLSYIMYRCMFTCV